MAKSEHPTEQDHGQPTTPPPSGGSWKWQGRWIPNDQTETPAAPE